MKKKTKNQRTQPQLSTAQEDKHNKSTPQLVDTQSQENDPAKVNIHQLQSSQEDQHTNSNIQPQRQSQPQPLQQTQPQQQPSTLRVMQNFKRKRAEQNATEPAIDDPHVEESWNRKPKKKFSHFNASTLHKIKDNPTKLKEILYDEKKQTRSKAKTKASKGNWIIDHPATYYAPQVDFVVASTGALTLSQNLYKELLPNVRLSNHVISYILAVFSRQYRTKSVQFEIYKTNTIIEQLDRPILKITKDILLAIYYVESIKHFNLVIVNSTDATFSVIDPMDPTDISAKYLPAFHRFLEKHKSFDGGAHLVESSLWACKHYKHQLQVDTVNCGIYVLQFIKQFLLHGKIDEQFSPDDYRVELQHEILRKSIDMHGRCIKCGLGKYKDKLLWVQCDHCQRWVHSDCAETDENIADESIHYFCLICLSNSPKVYLQSNVQNVDENFQSSPV